MKYNIIAIEREYASGGREIGKRTASKLGIPYYGEEILDLAAERKNTSREYLEHLEETTTNSFLYSIYMLSAETPLTNGLISPADSLHFAEREIILEIADKGPAVIIGHCASHVLKDRKDVLNVFVHSNRQSRLERTINEYQIAPNEAESTLKRFDKRRSNYFNANTSKKWYDITNYHLVLDSGKLGFDACAELIAQVAGVKAG